VENYFLAETCVSYMCLAAEMQYSTNVSMHIVHQDVVGTG